MKILHIMNWFRENMGYQENYLPFYQAGLGHSVRILCSKHFLKKRDFPENAGCDTIYNDRQLEIKRLQSIYIRHFMEQNWYINFDKEINDFNPDIVHLHNFWSLPSIQFLTARLKKRKNIKVCVDSHIDNGNFDYKKIHRAIYYFGFIKKIIIPYMLKQNFLFLAANPYAQRCLNSYFDIPKKKIRDLFLGIDSEKIFFSHEHRKIMRKQYNISEGAIVFVFAGVFEYSKDIITLLSAFNQLAKKYNHIFLLMIGKGDFAETDEIRELRRIGKIIVSGWQNILELYKWYSMSDIGVMPGKLGGIRDILAAGRPLIINDDTAVSYLNEYDNGLVFKRGSAEGLIQGMETYIKSPSLIKVHGERSLKLVKDKLSWRNIASQSLCVYNEHG